MTDFKEVDTFQWIIVVLYIIFIIPITFFEYNLYLARANCSVHYAKQIKMINDFGLMNSEGLNQTEYEAINISKLKEKVNYTIGAD